jgi:hypothetical protein
LQAVLELYCCFALHARIVNLQYAMHFLPAAPRLTANELENTAGDRLPWFEM